MARTGLTGPVLKPTAEAGSSRPQPLFPSEPDSFTADIGLTIAIQVRDTVNGVILLPQEYIHDPDPDCPEASWRESYLAKRCFKTTVAYEQISSSSSTHLHSRIVPFIRRDPWTGFPILARPSGPPLDRFLDQNRKSIYDEASHRVRVTHRPLVYKWALQLVLKQGTSGQARAVLSALEFVHAQDIILGDLDTAHCWLSSSPTLSLALVGFLDSSFRDKSSGILYLGDSTSSEPFHPLNNRQPGARRAPEPSMQTDLFLWGCVVYELMVGHWPGHEEGANRSWDDMSHMISRQEWPILEREYLGEVIMKCWTGRYSSSQSLWKDLLEVLRERGWRVNAGDDLQFDASPLFDSTAVC